MSHRLNFYPRSLHILTLFISLSLISLLAYSQADPDQLYKEARTLAFSKKDYPAAITYAKQALVIDPGYSDIRVFLGSLYTWTDQPDSARMQFQRVLQQHPEHEDAAVAYSSLEFWNKNNQRALSLIDSGLVHSPGSERLLVLKVKVLSNLNRPQESSEALKTVLKINPANTEARVLSSDPAISGYTNQFGISYQHLKYEEQFDEPWQLLNLDYTRFTSLGPFTARIYRADRFGKTGSQFELEAYPKLGSRTYAYLSGAWSEQNDVFPQHRAALSIFTALPAAFEAEGGVRMLDFGDATWLYTAALGKYHKNFWFNLRGFINPERENRTLSATLSTRYYLGGKDDFLSLTMGTGVSPDNQVNNVLYRDENLKVKNLGLGLQHAIKTRHLLNINLGLIDQEYRTDMRDLQFEFSAGYRLRF